MWLPLMHPLLGTWPTTQACTLTGNQTSSPLVHRLALNPLSHTSQGSSIYLDMRNQPEEVFCCERSQADHSWCRATDRRIWGRQLGMWVDQSGPPSLC